MEIKHSYKLENIVYNSMAVYKGHIYVSNRVIILIKIKLICFFTHKHKLRKEEITNTFFHYFTTTSNTHTFCEVCLVIHVALYV